MRNLKVPYRRHCLLYTDVGLLNGWGKMDVAYVCLCHWFKELGAPCNNISKMSL